MARDRGISKQPVAAVDLRRRASRVRCLMGGMISKANYDRLRDYVDDLEMRAAALDAAPVLLTTQSLTLPRSQSLRVRDWAGAQRNAQGDRFN